MCILDVFEKTASILLSVVSVVGIVFGIITAHNFKSKIEDKRMDSLFSFYSRLKVYLLDFKNRLGKSPNKSVLLCKYTDNSVGDLDSFMKPKEDEVKSFIDFILNFIDFLKNSENQISINKSFHNDFRQIKITLFDLTELAGVTPYAEYNNNRPVSREYNTINSLIDNLLRIIENEQNTILGYIEGKQGKKQCLFSKRKKIK